MIPEFRIPGTLSKTSDDCNTYVGATYCRDCGKAEARFYHCNNWDCPECYFFTSVRAAHRVEDRLLGVHRAYAECGKRLGRGMHLTFSVPASEYDAFDLGTAWKQCIKYSELVGVLGGAAIFHPYRIKGEYRKRLFDAVKSAGLKGGLWSGVHCNVLHLESWRDYVYFAPHFHVLGYYPKIVMKSNVFHELTGWVYKAIGVGKDRNFFTTARYLFTHTAVPDGHKQAVHYFGVASYSKTSVKSTKTRELMKCPHCGSSSYYLLTGYSSVSYERLIAGTWLPEDKEFVNARHVLLTKTVKVYTAHWKGWTCVLPGMAEVNA